MATYVIGDVQGCFDSLKALLNRFGWSRERDELWFVGDLVNRGPKSLDVLRFVMDLGPAARCVLGNHDLHLLARLTGVAGEKNLDTLDAVLAARDVDQITEWIATRPLLHEATVNKQRYVMVHAGLLPQWSLGEAEAHARSIEAELARPASRRSLLEQRKKHAPLRALTTMRTIHADGTLCEFSGKPIDAPDGCKPWFLMPHVERRATVVFGHWSALGLHLGTDAIGLDTGCVWGGKLSAIRLEDRTVFAQPAAETGPAAPRHK